tara:strand:- start:552 stop:1283 length:732 start_codon:yes stop_codon:yes gene_type:complete
MLKLNIVKKEVISDEWSVEKVASNPPPSWEAVFESAVDEIKDIADILEAETARRLPDNRNLFRIFNLVPLNKVRVVLFGQDPYHTVLPDGKTLAVGMSFSVPREAPIPSSLKNIFKELQNSVAGFRTPSNGDLTPWATKGVFLLNTCLTVREGEAGCHKEIWFGFIKKVINAILHANPNTIFVLWGKKAQNMKKIIGERAMCLETSHPSGLSSYRGFIGCNHFNLINEYLVSKGDTPIDWNLY